MHGEAYYPALATVLLFLLSQSLEQILLQDEIWTTHSESTQKYCGPPVLETCASQCVGLARTTRMGLADQSAQSCI